MYTCPMHPEVTSEDKGKCPKCGMDLLVSTLKIHDEYRVVEKSSGKNYYPLIVAIFIITLSSLMVSRNETVRDFLLNFMTGFFLVFSGFKLMDLKGFAEGYSTYDIIAKRWFAYGYIYPFIELSFGLLMLASYHPDWLLWSEFVVMTLSGIGVAIKLARKEEVVCACLGTFLKVPLTKVTLIEDFGMATLALILIW